MRTPFESKFVRRVCTLMVVFLVFSWMGAFAQERFLLTLGCSYSDATLKLAQFPQLSRSGEQGKTLRLENEYLVAQYQFEDDGLEAIHVARNYQSSRLALASLEAHLIWLERAGATVFPLNVTRHKATYFAMTDHAAYELTLDQSLGKNRMLIRVWKRAASTTKLDGDYTFSTMMGN